MSLHTRISRIEAQIERGETSGCDTCDARGFVSFDAVVRFDDEPPRVCTDCGRLLTDDDRAIRHAILIVGDAALEEAESDA